MALRRNEPRATVRRVTAGGLVVSIGAGLFLGTLIGSLVGFIVFIIGLVLTGLFYVNVSRVMRTRGMR